MKHYAAWLLKLCPLLSFAQHRCAHFVRREEGAVGCTPPLRTEQAHREDLATASNLRHFAPCAASFLTSCAPLNLPLVSVHTSRKHHAEMAKGKTPKKRGGRGRIGRKPASSEHTSDQLVAMAHGHMADMDVDAAVRVLEGWVQFPQAADVRHALTTLPPIHSER